MMHVSGIHERFELLPGGALQGTVQRHQVLLRALRADAGARRAL